MIDPDVFEETDPRSECLAGLPPTGFEQVAGSEEREGQEVHHKEHTGQCFLPMAERILKVEYIARQSYVGNHTDSHAGEVAGLSPAILGYLLLAAGAAFLDRVAEAFIGRTALQS